MCSKVFSERFFARTRTLQFWKSYNYFSAKSPKNWKNKNVFRSEISILSPTHVNCCFDTPRKFLPKNKKVTAATKLIQKSKFLRTKKWSSQSFPLDARVTVVTTLGKNFPSKGLTFSAQSPKKGEILSKASNNVFL